jgi:hypothetical protein
MEVRVNGAATDGSEDGSLGKSRNFKHRGRTANLDATLASEDPRERLQYPRIPAQPYNHDHTRTPCIYGRSVSMVSMVSLGKNARIT